MNLDSLVHIMSGDGLLALKNATRFLHFIGLALGLGAATLLDLMLLRFFVKGRISRENWHVVEFGAKMVSFGLFILWATGVAFILQYAFTDPVKLTNEKLWAKLVIVAVLTINGMFIHSVILPRLKARIGRPIFAGMGNFARTAFVMAGAISATSWYAPVAIGAFSQLNFAVPATVLLSIYAVLLALMTLVMHGVMSLVARRSREVALPVDIEPAPRLRFGHAA
jgi:hypothetical protein